MDGSECRVGTDRRQPDAHFLLVVQRGHVTAALALPVAPGLHRPTRDEAVLPVQPPAVTNVLRHRSVEQQVHLAAIARARLV
eukprot:3498909-Alexandrium_andersonii.AAC.1